MASVLSRSVGTLCLGLLLQGCSEKTAQESTQTLNLPERLAEKYVTDQMTLAGVQWVLWDDSGGCKVQVGNTPAQWLKPMAPCYFIKSPGRQEVQVFRLDKTTQIVAVVGTPSQKKRCGQEVQGLVTQQSNTALPSTYIMQGSEYCADQGLQNFQYGLFAHHNQR